MKTLIVAIALVMSVVSFTEEVRNSEDIMAIKPEGMPNKILILESSSARQLTEDEVLFQEWVHQLRNHIAKLRFENQTESFEQAWSDSISKFAQPSYAGIDPFVANNSSLDELKTAMSQLWDLIPTQLPPST